MQILETDLLTFAREETRRYQQKYVRTEHLLLALLRLDSSLGIDYDQLSSHVADLPFPTCGAEETLELANGAQRALEATYNDDNREYIESEILMQHLINHSPVLRRILREMDSTEEG